MSRIAISGLLLLIALLSGVWLSRNLKLNDPRPSGKPLTGTDSAVHKLSALAMGIIAGVTIRNLHRGIEFRGIEFTAVIIAGLLFVLLTVIATSGAIYLLTRGRW